jgi:hypothetical protein
MTKRFDLAVLALSLICAFSPARPGHAASVDRAAVEARVRTEVAQDLSALWRPWIWRKRPGTATKTRWSGSLR